MQIPLIGTQTWTHYFSTKKYKFLTKQKSQQIDRLHVTLIYAFFCDAKDFDMYFQFDSPKLSLN